MDRRLVWPDFLPAWVVYEDDDLIAVDKPCGIPSQAADDASPYDLVTRLRAWLATRADAQGLTGARASTYLGVHQRLDRDTSGVVVMTRRREANASLAQQFEGRTAEKRYLAGVVGWPAGKPKRTLRDHLGPGRDGQVAVVPPKDKRAQLAVTHVEVREQRPPRSLLAVTLETGRTHQARVQLAHAGAPIAGDTLYARSAAPRLMLHAESVTIAHPTTKRPTTLKAPRPRELSTWLARGDLGPAVYDDVAAFEDALARATLQRFALGRGDTGERATTAFRLVHESGDALPGLAIDVYGSHLVAQLYEDDAGTWSDRARREKLLDRLGELGFDGVYLKVRPKQANTLVDTRREELAPKDAVRGANAADEIVVFEDGVPYGARLGDGLSTGLFLDQRTNRRRVREAAAGKRVLNLFAYTCAFSAAAARGGARETVSVDAASVALERGRENLARVGATDERAHRLLAEDAFDWLAQAARRKERFDSVVLDPPSYSSTKTARFVGRSDYADLAALALQVVAPGGALLACSNHRQVSASRFRKFLYDAARQAERNLLHARDVPTPRDFPPPPGGESHLKSVWVTVA